MGLGFILTALAIIRTGASPLSTSETLPILLKPLEAEPILAILISAILTYMMHSGLSAVLLFATLVSSQVLSLELACLFVVGANVGVGLIPLIAVMRDIPQAVQIPLGNIIMRMIVGIIALVGMPYILEFLNAQPWDIHQKIITLHIGYNIFLAILFMPLITPLASLCAYLSPARDDTTDVDLRPKYLDNKLLSSPSAALSCATRETLRISEILEDMLVQSYAAIASNNQSLINDILQKDDGLDLIFAEIKHYIIKLTREELSDSEAAQSMRIMSFATNIEHCGDIIEKSLMDNATKKVKRNDQFSDEGLAEIKSIHGKVVKNLQLAQSIFLSSDRALAKQLLDYKKGLKHAEIDSGKNHINRLREGLPATIATSGMHMDIIRDLRRINTYISSVAYTILEDEEKKLG